MKAVGLARRLRTVGRRRVMRSNFVPAIWYRCGNHRSNEVVVGLKSLIILRLVMRANIATAKGSFLPRHGTCVLKS